MTSNDLEDALGDAEDAFQRTPEIPETGLEYVTESSVIQLRKACRLLDAAGFLLERNGHFTVIIESSFVAIERSIQFYVQEKGYDVAAQRHTEVYELAVQAGLFSEDIADRLEALWLENRSESYYRTGIAGEYRAKTVYQLASKLHDEVVELTRTHDCICE
ncbi:hypothetical protein [Natrinema salaciae]|uniref:DUF8154 domain-containing protein n=1 Tax=Natrinema salaciae TaxID=1186196 RepID=A0A1H9MB71_9EURY|nr:hypothetical protein [Natrinema salaciae]SER20851.1 hypothetical protein SAMN04489841_3286 [Natrinema salaciae]